MSDGYSNYSNTIDSGDAWVGELPVHWDIARLKQLFFIQKTIAGELGYDVLSVTQRGLKVKDITSGDGQLSMDYSKYQLVCKGNFVMNHMDLLTGSIDISDQIGVTSPDYRVFSPLDPGSLSPQFYLRIFQLCYVERIFYPLGQGSAQLGRWRLPRRAFESFNLPFPPLPEQTQIAKFLDYETAKIDALIEKQERLISLLQEKRQAVISHAVTKGLNPDASMRDSGIEWLGEVPAHWEMSKFGYISSVVRGASPRPAGDPKLFNGNFSPWVTVAEITKDNNTTLTSTSSYLTQTGSKSSRMFTSGTLLISNSGATLGVPKILMINANANDGVVGFEKLNHSVYYCYYYLTALTSNLRERIKQGSGQPNLNTDIIKSIPVPIPSSAECESIVSWLQRELDQFDSLEGKAVCGVSLLRERRTALISAAVTGKIDVRSWTPPATPPQGDTP